MVEMGGWWDPLPEELPPSLAIKTENGKISLFLHRLVEQLDNGFWRVKVFFGFMERPDLPTTLDWCEEHGLNLDSMETTFFVGRETLIPSPASPGMALWRERLFVLLARNSTDPSTWFRIPPGRIVELGIQIEL